MASAKGGSGKTILTATFSEFLCSLGKRVLIVDTDASTNGLSLLYLKEIMVQYESTISHNNKAIGTYEIASVEGGYEVYSSPTIVTLANNVHLVPATYTFINTENVRVGDFEKGLKYLLNGLGSEYEFIFLDAQAGSDLFAYAAMKRGISNQVVIVSEYDPLSAAGVERLKALFREELTYNRTWVLLNKMLPDFIQSFSDFLEVARYLNPIPWDADVVRAYARRKLALELEYGNEFTLAIMQTMKSLFRDELSDELVQWSENKSTSIREPIELQYKDMEIQLDGLLKEEYRYKTQQYKWKLWLLSAIITIFLFAIIGFIVISYRIAKETKVIDKSVGSGSITTILISILMAFVPIVLIVIYRTWLKPFLFSNDSNEYLAQSRLKREISQVEEKLKKLGLLKHADLETLIKEKIRRSD